jgi:Peptidase_C39 like family/Tetratricopeptide repeat
MFIPLLTIHAERRPDMPLSQVGNRLIAGLLFLALCILPAGCTLVPPGYLSQSPGRPAKAMVEDVPFFPQEELQCGPAALAMVLNWSGVAVSPSELSSQVYTPGLKGSLQNALVGASRRHGRVAYPIAGINALMSEIAAGQPVIVLVNLGFFWYPRWHYAVVIGYDQEKETIILHSGRTAGEVLSFWTFNNIWKRGDYWGLLVLPPTRLAAVAEEKKWLTAVAGLEKAGQWQAAASGYAAALKRWDKSFIGWMGLGNSEYHLHELDVAADAFHQAALLQPESGVAYNNWANVLGEQGKREEALKAAQRAVELGGPFQDTFRQTLEDLEKRELHKGE